MRFIERLVRVAVAVGLASAGVMAATVELKRGEDRIEVMVGGKPFTTYYFLKDVAKAYLMPLRTPSGVIVSRPFPVFNDVSMADRKLPGFEPHQRPLYFGHGDIDGVDFWSEAVFSSAFAANAKQPAAPRPVRAHGHMTLIKLEEVKEWSRFRHHPRAFQSGGPEQPGSRRRDPDLHVPWRRSHTHDRLRVRLVRAGECHCLRRHQGRHLRRPAECGPEHAARSYAQLARRSRRTGDLGQAGRLGELLRDGIRQDGGCGRIRPSFQLPASHNLARPRVTGCWPPIRSPPANSPVTTNKMGVGPCPRERRSPSAIAW